MGVGTLGEKSLHAVLKRAVEPDLGCHEIRVGTYIADVLNENGIFEVQTRSLFKLKPKLQAFLQDYPVTVVYPILARKDILWLDGETGALSEKRRSPGTGGFSKALPELGPLKPFLLEEKFTLLLVLLAAEEIRYLNGGGENKKRRATRCELIPTAFLQEKRLCTAEDYKELLPEALPEAFTALELGKALKLPKAKASAAANVLAFTGAIEKTGLAGRAYVYKRT